MDQHHPRHSKDHARGRSWPGKAFPWLGLAALLWWLLRVLPKPRRAGYPCQRLAAPLAGGFLAWILGPLLAAGAIRRLRRYWRRRRLLPLCLCLAVAAAAIAGTLAFLPRQTALSADASAPHKPLGGARGSQPGRVAWVHDPAATDWDGIGDYWWRDEHTDRAVVEAMFSRGLTAYTGKKNTRQAWETLFVWFNESRGRRARGYRAGEKIAIKINLTTCNNFNASVDPVSRRKTGYLNNIDTSPQVIRAVLASLVAAGVGQAEIAVGDTLAIFPEQWYAYLHTEFPKVVYFDYLGGAGRVKAVKSSAPEDRICFSDPAAQEAPPETVPVIFAAADYVINIAVLKGHSAGVTLCAKNLYGSLCRTPDGRADRHSFYNLHLSLPSTANPGRGKCRALIDLLGQRDLGGKTILNVIDGLYGGYYWEGRPFKWRMAPFNGDWPSSLFLSEDPVAIDSVGYDFLLAEWPAVVTYGSSRHSGRGLGGGAEDYLHEAALAGKPPSGTVYAPNGQGTRLDSLGVHEHWNDPIHKQYARNLGKKRGIDLLRVP